MLATDAAQQVADHWVGGVEAVPGLPTRGGDGGDGQPLDQRGEVGGEAAAYTATLAAARQHGGARAMAELEAIGPPHKVAAMRTLRRRTAAAGGEYLVRPARWLLAA